jgi:hypothetical protein
MKFSSLDGTINVSNLSLNSVSRKEMVWDLIFSLLFTNKALLGDRYCVPKPCMISKQIEYRFMHETTCGCSATNSGSHRTLYELNLKYSSNNQANRTEENEEDRRPSCYTDCIKLYNTSILRQANSSIKFHIHDVTEFFPTKFRKSATILFYCSQCKFQLA